MAEVEVPSIVDDIFWKHFQVEPEVEVQKEPEAEKEPEKAPRTTFGFMKENNDELSKGSSNALSGIYIN